MKPPKMTEREIDRHCARVYLREARRRAGTWFAPVLLQWARNARNRSHGHASPAKQLSLNLGAAGRHKREEQTAG